MPDPLTSFSGIFVSYRRADTAGHAGRLYDTLVEHFGADHIFMDVDTIEPGDDFVTVIEAAVASCQVLIAVIGSQWLTHSTSGTRTLDNSTDFVRVEIAAALKRNIRVIPVLVQRARMPRPQDLPADLVNLARRNALELSDYRWQFDVNELIHALTELGVPVKKPAADAESFGGVSKFGRKLWHRRLGSMQTTNPALSDDAVSTPDQLRPIGVNKKLLVGIVAAAILIGIFVISLVRRDPKSVPPQTNLISNQTVPAQPPAGMAYIPGGKIQLGFDPTAPSKTEISDVSVDPFFLDVFEVTCEQYKKFLDANPEQAAPPDWKNRIFPTGWARKPVTGVDWDQASAFAVWSGKRLPMEAEWEYAARGADGRLYPWGNVWKTGLANTGKPEAGPTDGARGLAEVGRYKGASPFGVYDLVGNAWEWTGSSFKESSEHDSSRALQDLKVIRGGSWASRNEQATTIFRRGYGARGEVNGYSYTGFRLAQDIGHATNH